jgi:hypothetical protein
MYSRTETDWLCCLGGPQENLIQVNMFGVVEPEYQRAPWLTTTAGKRLPLQSDFVFFIATSWSTRP